jgi:ParB family chromosome partitioning protein
MDVQTLAIADIDISGFNTRKQLANSDLSDSSLDALAASIKEKGLLQPIIVVPAAAGRYEAIAGQRRLLACRQLGLDAIEAVVKNDIDGDDARALSLVENVHREDMNPHDKAVALKALADRFDGDLGRVAKETGLARKTVRKYVRLLHLAPELQDRLAAGEASNTEALARLADKFGEDSQSQIEVWDRIKNFTQDIQLQIIRRVSLTLDNLKELVDGAVEGRLGVHLVRDCPFDCPAVPAEVKDDVARMMWGAEL